MRNMQKILEDKLNTHFAPCIVEVINESAHHSGHAGDDGSGESHFKVIVASNQFAGLSRIAQQRLVIKVLDKELKIIHALSIITKTLPCDGSSEKK